MSDTTDHIEVPDDPFVWLAIAADEYAAADRALWRVKNAHERTQSVTDAHRKHLDVLRRRRRDAYSSLIAWASLCEAQRLAAQAAQEYRETTA